MKQKKKYRIKSFPNIKIDRRVNKKRKTINLGGCDDLESYLNVVKHLKTKKLNIENLYILYKLSGK